MTKKVEVPADVRKEIAQEVKESYTASQLHDLAAKFIDGKSANVQMRFVKSASKDKVEKMSPEERMEVVVDHYVKKWADQEKGEAKATKEKKPKPASTETKPAPNKKPAEKASNKNGEAPKAEAKKEKPADTKMVKMGSLSANDKFRFKTGSKTFEILDKDKEGHLEVKSSEGTQYWIRSEAQLSREVSPV